VLGAHAITFGDNVASEPNLRPHAELAAYWTEERMAKAIPKAPKSYKMEANGKAPQFSTQSQSHVGTSNDANTIPASIPDYLKVASPSDDGLSYPFPFTVGYASSYTGFPYSTIGRLYFTQGGRNYVGSAAVVGKFLVFTSADNVYSYSLQAWSTNVYFIPGYNYGQQPFGTFNYYQLFAKSLFTTGGSESLNYAAVVLYPSQNSGSPIAGLTGALGFAWNQVYYQTWRVTGYPASTPFTGNTNYYTDSYFGAIDTNYGNFTIGVGNNSTGGISGAPYVENWGLTPGGYYVNSVVAYKYTSQPNAVYGPYFDKYAYSLYNTSNFVVPPSL